jgi:hypothetical protein
MAGLEALIGGLERLATHGFSDIQDETAKAVQGVVDSQYQAGVSPDGERWADKADGTASYLRKTGDMARDSKAIRGVSGVDVKIPSPGGYHQSGTKNMDVRKLVPDGELTPTWQQAIDGAAESVIAKAIGS